MTFSEAHYNKLKPLEHYWNTFKKSGTVLSIQPFEIDIIDQVHTEVIGVKLNKSCNNCVADGLISVFIQYGKFQIINENIKNTIGQVEATRQERPRIQQQKRG